MRNIPKLFVGLCALTFLFIACSKKGKQYVIGISQCSNDEWRTQMNKEIYREALFYPEIKIEIRSANDNNKQQISDIEYFIKQKVDLLIIAPNEAEAITPIIEKAYEKRIPIVLVDRKINSDKYTAYIGANNYKIGWQVGTYVANRLQGKGNIVELTGLQASTPAQERHQGFIDALTNHSPHMRIIATSDASWQKQAAEVAFDSILNKYSRINLVFAHNDQMAIGAYHAASKRKRNKEIIFVGIDALRGKGLGIESVIEGKLDASFIYPTGGDKVMQIAIAILKGQNYPRETQLSTALVNEQNARIMQMQTTQINALDKKIELLDNQINAFILKYSAQRMLLYACITIIVLTIGLLFFIVKAFWIKKRMNTELSTQKIQLEHQRDQLITLSHQLKEATNAKLTFFTNISHDFQMPLNLIADPIQQLLKNKSLDEHDYFLLNIVHKNVAVLLRLVNQVLDFRKFEKGKLVLRLSEFNLIDSLNEWTNAFNTLAFRKHIKFKLEIEGNKESYNMIADREKLERITYNLLSNAFKFTPDNGSISIHINHFSSNNKSWLIMKVSDNGIGMPQEHIQHIFENFYQINVHHAGSGIGLALVKAFVEMHHGIIEINSNKGEGTMISIKIPMEQQGCISNPIIENPQLTLLKKEGAVLSAEQRNIYLLPERINNQEKQYILVIDDNQDIRKYIKSQLQSIYTVIEAANGQEGIRQAMKYIPDAIICDTMMPIMDGMECCKRLKSELQTSHIPIIILTAYTYDEQIINSYQCGADSYISKPFSTKLLLTRLCNLIDNRKRLQTFFTEKANIQKSSFTEVDKKFINKLQLLIEKNMSDSNFKIEDLGEKIGLSRIQLYRKVKALTGLSPIELLRIARLKKAALLLSSTEKNIAEITYEVGFNTPSYFTKCYREYFGENPTDFIKRNK